jgi:hypothetical protein
MQFLSDMKQYALQIMQSNNDNTYIWQKFAFNEVLILGFNSAKFDINLLGKDLFIDDYKIQSTWGKSSYYKCMKLSTSFYKNTKLKKLDLDL